MLHVCLKTNALNSTELHSLENLPGTYRPWYSGHSVDEKDLLVVHVNFKHPNRVGFEPLARPVERPTPPARDLQACCLVAPRRALSSNFPSQLPSSCLLLGSGVMPVPPGAPESP